MSRAKNALKQKRLSKAVPLAGIAGVSLAMAGGASATAPAGNAAPSLDTASRQVITLGEEEISDVSLGTFYVFDKEHAPQAGQNIQLARGCGGRGCGGRGCGGRGCGRGCGGCRGCGHGCGHGCGCWGGCGCGCCLSWGGCGLC